MTLYSLEHLQAIIGLLITEYSNILILLCLRNSAACGEGERWGNIQSVEQPEYTHHLLMLSSHQAWFEAPPKQLHSNIKNLWPQTTIKYNNNEKELKYCEKYQNITQRH